MTIEELLKAAKSAEAAGDEEAVKALLRRAKAMRSESAPEKPQEPRQSKIKGGVRALAQGISLGFGDEAEAYIRSTFTGQDREELLNEIRSDIKQFRRQAPVLSTALEVGGAVGGALIPVAGATGLAARLGLKGAQAAGLGGNLARGAAMGGAEGAIAGFGSGEGGFSNRLESAATGAALGAGLGGAAPVVGGVLGDVGSRVFDGFGLSGSKRASELAERRVAKAVEREGMTPESLGQRLQEAQQSGVRIMPADVGEATRGAAYAAQAVPSSMRTGVLEALSERGVEQGARIADATAEKMDAAGSYGLDYLDDLFEQSQQKFKPLYDAAEKDIPSAPFQKYADRKVFKQAFRAVQSRADTLGEEALPSLEEALAGGSVPTSYLQKIAQGLDRVIAQNTDTVTGKMNDTARDVLTVRNQFKSDIGDLNGAYKKADAQFADMMDLRRAYDVGDAYEKLSSQEFARKVAKMTSGEVDAMKVGMITRIRNISSGSDRTDYVQRLFGSPKRREALKSAFPSEEEFAKFERYMNFEKDISRTQRRVLGGSDTQRNLLEAQEQGVDPQALLGLLTGGKGEAIRQTGAMLSSRAQGIGTPVAEEMSKMLFANTPAAQREMLQRLASRSAADAAKRQQLSRRPETYGGILGATSGLMQNQ